MDEWPITTDNASEEPIFHSIALGVRPACWTHPYYDGLAGSCMPIIF